MKSWTVADTQPRDVEIEIGVFLYAGLGGGEEGEVFAARDGVGRGVGGEGLGYYYAA